MNKINLSQLRAFFLGCFVALSIAVLTIVAHAGEVSFTAEVDQKQISLDQLVTVIITVKTDGSEGVDEFFFQSPDFEVVGRSRSSSATSHYDSSTGKAESTNIDKIVRILKPLKTGKLTIRRIEAKVGARPYSAPDIVINVTPSAAGSANVQGNGQITGQATGLGVSGAQNTNSPEVVIRGEIDKEQAFKGEQVIVSYYLYRKGRVYGIQINKFPELKGFLREEVEMPVVGGQLDSTEVFLNGVPYYRSLLARYAAYPLQEGKLNIDAMGLKYNYVPSNDGLNGANDPFFQLFQQAQPRAGSTRSEPLTVQVAPLPTAGKPQLFSGAVGEYSIISAVDKYQVRANEAVTLTVKIEGKGNLSSVSEPQTKWPENLDLYDTKGKVNFIKGGLGSKVFEFLLIPRVEGNLLLPAQEFTYFDPSKKQYVTSQTQPIQIQVLPADPNSPAMSQNTAVTHVSPSQGNQEGGGYLEPPSATVLNVGGGFWNWVYYTFFLGSILLIGWIGSDFLRKALGIRKRGVSQKNHPSSIANEKIWAELRNAAQLADQAGSSLAWEEVSKKYDALNGLVFDALDRTYRVGARALSRSSLEQTLVTEREMDPILWDRIEQILEFGDLVRFASSVGVVSEAAARADLKKWVDEAESVTRVLEEVGDQVSSYQK